MEVSKLMGEKTLNLGEARTDKNNSKYRDFTGDHHYLSDDMDIMDCNTLFFLLLLKYIWWVSFIIHTTR